MQFTGLLSEFLEPDQVMLQDTQLRRIVQGLLGVDDTDHELVVLLSQSLHAFQVGGVLEETSEMEIFF